MKHRIPTEAEKAAKSKALDAILEHHAALGDHNSKVLLAVRRDPGYAARKAAQLKAYAEGGQAALDRLRGF